MKRFRLVSICMITLALLAPALSQATLSSENFVVEGPAVGSPNVTFNASSSNYDADIESGGLYQIDDSPATPPGGSSGGGTRTDNDTINDDVLGKNDNITICHAAGKTKYVTLSNVQVFMTITLSGLAAELRGHDGHSDDIVPAFKYDFGEGIKTYPGNNWTIENQKLHANNCRLFLADTPPVTVPTTSPPAPVPPLQEPITICDTTSVYTKTTTAIDENSLVSIEVPQGAVRSVQTEEKGNKNYQLNLKVVPVDNNRSEKLVDKFVSILDRFQEKKDTDEAPYGILKKVSETQAAPYVQAGALQNVSSNLVPVVSQLPCEPAVSPPQTPPPSVVPVVSPPVAPVESPAIIVSELLNEEILFDWVPTEMELLVPPFQVVIEDPEGKYLDEFESPLIIEITNPQVAGLDKEHILIMQPSEDGSIWYEVPFEIDGDTLRITIERPGEFFVWFLPRTAEAAELTPSEQIPSRMPLVDFEIPLLLAQLISYIGIGVGALYSVLRVSGTPFSTTHLSRSIFGGWHNFIALFVSKKRRRPWGTVYDSVTKAPVDPAYVELFDETGKNHASAITDLDGRYGFLVPEGVYTMKVQKTNYTFPSRRVSLTGEDVLYSQLYYGGPLTVSASVAHDIPVDPVGFDWNQYEKIRTKQTHFFNFFDPFIVGCMDLVFFIGAGLMVWQFMANPSLINGILLGVYSILLILRFTADKPVLYGSVSENNKPLQFALVHIKQGDVTIITKVTDVYGRYFAIVAPETYTVVIEKRIGEEMYEKILERQVRANKGVINSSIRV